MGDFQRYVDGINSYWPAFFHETMYHNHRSKHAQLYSFFSLSQEGSLICISPETCFLLYFFDDYSIYSTKSWISSIRYWLSKDIHFFLYMSWNLFCLQFVMIQPFCYLSIDAGRRILYQSCYWPNFLICLCLSSYIRTIFNKWLLAFSKMVFYLLIYWL